MTVEMEGVMNQTIELNQILNVKQKIESPIDELEVLGQLTKGVILTLVKVTGLTKKEIIEILPRSEKTIERLKNKETLELSLAEHLVGVAKVAIEGNELYENPKTFAKWLKTPHRVLCGLEPYEILRTVMGCNIIIDLLGRTKYGVYN